LKDVIAVLERESCSASRRRKERLSDLLAALFPFAYLLLGLSLFALLFRRFALLLFDARLDGALLRRLF
ncbi:MAG TPA: hypothetical protein VFY36_10170, partial [Solirubrobacteraceae bacterium]|nr:hypothetical protein [Solirubrobacteraceae bacterium]